MVGRSLVAAVILVVALAIAVVASRRLFGGRRQVGSASIGARGTDSPPVAWLDTTTFVAWLRQPLGTAVLWWTAGAVGMSLVLLVLSLAGVSALQGRGVRSSSAGRSSAERMLLDDDFSGQPDLWANVVGDRNGYEQWEIVVDGEGDGRLCSTGRDEYSYTYVRQPYAAAWRDYRLDLEFRLEGCPDPKAGIVVRETGAGGYHISLEPDAVGVSWYSDFPYVGPPGYELTNAVQVVLATDEWHSAVVAVVGPKLSLFIDDEFVIAYTDDSEGTGERSSGGIGMTEWARCVVCFDDVRVSKLSAVR
jgi:hypothetical protein